MTDKDSLKEAYAEWYDNQPHFHPKCDIAFTAGYNALHPITEDVLKKCSMELKRFAKCDADMLRWVTEQVLLKSGKFSQTFKPPST